MNLMKKIALKEVLKKAEELHKKGKTVEEIVNLFLAEPKVVEGLVALDVDDAELTKMIKDKVK